MKCCIRFLLFGFVAVCVGCGPSVGQVSGVVTYRGSPLPGGTVTFRPVDPTQNSVAYVLENDGRFNVTLPAGEVAVCVDNRELEPPPPTVAPTFEVLDQSKLPATARQEIQSNAARASREAARASSNYKKIPDKYYAIETSGLTILVKEGEQTAPIELKD